VVNQVEFCDRGSLASASDDCTTRFLDVVTETHTEEMLGEEFTFSENLSDKQTVGKYLVSKKGDLVMVHLTDTKAASASESKNFESDRDSKSESKPVAFFRAPASISALECAGEKITVGCENGEVLHLRAAFLIV